MLLPLIKGGTYGKFATSVGLMVYDVLAGVEKAEQRVMLSKDEVLKQEPLLHEEILEGGGLYAEYRTDDARLSLEVLKTASLYGAHSINYVEATDFIYENERVVGAVCKEMITGEVFHIKARQVVNAAGPWVDELREKNHSLSGKHLFLSKGVHIVVPHERLPVKQSIYFDVPDGRMIFAIPRSKITYIGTTDTEYHGDKNNPRTNLEDVRYLVDAVNNTFPTVNLTVSDVISSWAGLRPLIHEEGKSASEISRKDEIFISDTRLISIAGGKLTGYRKMAERVVDVVARRLKKKFGTKTAACSTHKIIISGGGFSEDEDVNIFKQKVFEQLKPHGFNFADADHLVHNYGQQTDQILDHFLDSGDISPLGLAKSELWFGLQQEMIMSAMDYFSRRTGRLYFDIESVRSFMNPLLKEMSSQLSWNQERMDQERQWVEKAVEEASHFPSQKQG